jgi:hypothetical protein
MRLSKEFISDMRSKSAEGIFQAIRQLVRDEFGVVERDELKEALDDAVEAGLLEEREIRRLEDN